MCSPIAKKKTILSLKTLHKNVKRIHDLLFDDGTIYIICDAGYTNIMETYESFLQKKENKNVELFNIKRLLINITKHVYVPRHIKINSIKEIRELVHNLCIDSKYKLPIISHTDPVARYYNLKRGNVVKIIRDSPSYGKYCSYRVCSDIE